MRITNITGRKLTAFILVFLSIGVYGQADTFYLNGEVAVHGKLVRTDEKFYYIEIDGKPRRIPKQSVSLVEQNDKDGSFDLKAATEAAAKRQQEITEETGLTQEQREEIDKLIRDLNSEDGAVVGHARRTLAEMCKDTKVYRFIYNLVPSEAPYFIKPLLVILTGADPVQSKPLLVEFATYAEQETRAQCIELLGVIRDVSSLTLMMRGMLDHEPVVRLASCTALTAIGAKEATPLLLANFDHADLRVENYAREALAVMWKAELGDREPFKTLEEWQKFWEEQSPAVPKTVDLESLEPLVPPGTSYSRC